MAIGGNIITVGISPAWDVKCSVNGLEWGDHKVIDAQDSVPAGKALNVSKSLAWMGYPSIATGLWGQEDYDEMVNQLRSMSRFIDIRFAAVRGHTRKNITVHDTNKNRQMHLRLPGSLANKGSIKRLRSQLESLVSRGDLVVLSGSLPDGALMQDVIGIVHAVVARGAKVIVDTSGQALKSLAASNSAYLIAPNLEELCELVGASIKNESHYIERAARKLLSTTDNILVSRGEKGLLLITKSGSWSGKCEPIEPREVVNTVACGDHLVAGLISGLKEGGNLLKALENALLLASAHVFGMCDTFEWWQVSEMFDLRIEKL